ncbi:MAG: tRNA (N(6)-L-threonylcarbamoyladenosine(37)-C(2))-methylthiotransferase MtaB [Flavobacteriaceae bacterium]
MGVARTQTNRVAFYTLGCKLNFSETSTLARSLEKEGYQKVAFEEVADVYVINTCSVTDNADKKFRTIAKSAHQLNPEAYIVAVGCYAQLKPEELAAVDGVDMVLGAREKFSLSSYLNGLLESPKTNAQGHVHACEIEQTDTFVSSYAIGERTRAFLKVQDGCDYPCTYCTIPLARGISRSAPLQELLDQAKEIAAQGIKEIVLTGVNIGDYGKGEHGNKKHDHTFLELIDALDEVEGISRLRISSIEPNLLSDQIIDFVAQSKNFVPHFHIPLQSGSDTLLKRMKRRYLTNLYRQRIERIRSIMPDACIGVDVIVGFPGETDELFLETYQFLLDLEVSYLHVFTYSERENTAAASMEGAVPHEVRKKRSKMLRSLSEKKKRQFYEQHLGTCREVLFEKEISEGYAEGFTENYIRVRTPWDPSLSNSLQKVALDLIDNKGFARIK